MTLPCTAVMKEDKSISVDRKRECIKVDTEVLILNISHDPVYICATIKGDTFPVHKDLLTIK